MFSPLDCEFVSRSCVYELVLCSAEDAGNTTPAACCDWLTSLGVSRHVFWSNLQCNAVHTSGNPEEQLSEATGSHVFALFCPMSGYLGIIVASGNFCIFYLVQKHNLRGAAGHWVPGDMPAWYPGAI